MENERYEPIGNLFQDTIDDDRVETIHKAINEGRRNEHRGANQRQWRPIVVFASCSVAILLCLGLVFFWLNLSETSPSDDGSLSLSNGVELTSIQTKATKQRIELSDRSVIEVDQQSALTVVENSANTIVLELAQGIAHFEITPGGPRTWTIDAGIASVEVLGTQFTVSRSPDEVEVTVQRGLVRVRSHRIEGGSLQLGPGQDIAVRSAPNRIQEDLALQRPAQSVPDTEIEHPVEQPNQSPSATKTPPQAAVPVQTKTSWKQLAQKRQFSEAYAVLGSQGFQRETSSAHSLEELLSLADVARYSGHHRDAVRPLERAIADYPGERRAAVAAFTLGRLEADILNRQGKAVAAFRRCLELGPPRALQEDTYFRLAKAHAQRGEIAAARRAARQYIERFPNGRRTEELRRWLE